MDSVVSRGRSRTVATSKMEHFVITASGFQSLTTITKRSIVDVAAVLDTPLVRSEYQHHADKTTTC